MMIFLIGVIIGITTVAAAPADTYERRYDHLDIENILNNRRMVNYYAACLLSKGPCPPQGLDLKRVLPEALQTNCAKCSERQKTVAYRTVKRLKKEYPKIWDQLRAVWDPDEIYVNRFETSFENQNSVAPQVPQLFNRFGENEDSSDSSNVAVSSTITSSTSSTTKITTTSTSSPFTATTKPTKKPVTNPPFYAQRPNQVPPFTTVGANLQATVSFGTNLVGGIVRSLSTLGSKVVESGTKLANVVISAALRP